MLQIHGLWNVLSVSMTNLPHLTWPKTPHPTHLIWPDQRPHLKWPDQRPTHPISNGLTKDLPTSSQMAWPKTYPPHLSWPNHKTAHTTVCLSIYLLACLPVCMSICRFVFLCDCASLYLSVCIFICLSACLSIFLSVFQSQDKTKLEPKQNWIRSRNLFFTNHNDTMGKHVTVTTCLR